MENIQANPMEIMKAMSKREQQDKVNRFRILNQSAKAKHFLPVLH